MDTNQNGAVGLCEAIVRLLKMACQYVFFIDAFIGEKAIRRLGVRLILASYGDAFSNRIADLRQQLSESLN